jgi:hypothetical protein
MGQRNYRMAEEPVIRTGYYGKYRQQKERHRQASERSVYGSVDFTSHPRQNTRLTKIYALRRKCK